MMEIASNENAAPVAAEAPEIGPRLNAQRRALRWTLEDLAARSGVSRSMLSQIERGRANPTFATLWSLTRALGLDLAELADGGGGTGGAVDVAPAHFIPEIKSKDGLCRLQILSPIELAGRAEWYEVLMERGGSLVSDAHAAGSREHFTAAAGVFEIESGDGCGRIETGDTARYAADVPHAVRNVSEGPARGLLIVLRDA